MNLTNCSWQNWVIKGLVVITCWLWTGNTVYGQATKPMGLLHPQHTTILSAGCTVSQLQLRFRTGNDDLRGGQNNLNVEIDFADGTMQFEPNVNHGQRWADGSSHGAEVLLNRPVTVDQIKTITLSDTFTSGSGGDNWNMNSMQVEATVNSVSQRIAQFGFHRFSADSSGPKAKELTIPVK
jgi:hypothetical protein